MRAMDWWSSDARIAIRRGAEPARDGRCVVYWMQRAQRAFDNPALEAAIRAANELRLPAVVFFGLLTRHPVANLRHYTFMIEGLVDTAQRLERRGIGFVVRAIGQSYERWSRRSPLPVVKGERSLLPAHHLPPCNTVAEASRSLSAIMSSSFRQLVWVYWLRRPGELPIK